MKLNRSEFSERCPMQEKGTNFSDPFSKDTIIVLMNFISILVVQY